MTTERRWTLFLAAAVAVLTVGLLAVTSGRTLAEDGPAGTLALERVARDVGFDIDRGDTPPASGTFVLVTDLRQEESATDVLEWVAQGNRLVLADSDSVVLPLLGVDVTSRAGTSPTGVARLSADCDLAEVQDVEVLATRVGERRLDVPEDLGAATCFTDVGAPWLAIVPVGDGEVVLLGGSSPLRNEMLQDADNAMFALRLFGPTGRVRLGTAAPAPEQRGFWAALPDPALALVLAAMVAAGLVVATSWRRFGRPVPEPGAVVVEASTLLPSIAGLFRESGDRAHVAGRLQAHLTDLLSRRTGLPVDASTQDVAAVLADLTGTRLTEAHELLTTVPADEEALVRLARDVHHTLESLEAR